MVNIILRLNGDCRKSAKLSKGVTIKPVTIVLFVYAAVASTIVNQ